MIAPATIASVKSLELILKFIKVFQISQIQQGAKRDEKCCFKTD